MLQSKENISRDDIQNVESNSTLIMIDYEEYPFPNSKSF